MAYLDRDQARKELDEWFKSNRIRKKTIEAESNEDAIELLTDSIYEGTLIINEDNTLTHNLIFPIEGDITTESFTYKNSMTVGDTIKATSGIKASDAFGMLLGYVSFLTGQTKGVIKAMKTIDYKISQSIVIFFM